MNYAIALTVLEFLITILFYPMRIGAKGHASLAHDKIELDLTVFRLPVARLRIKKNEKKFELQVNGKPPKKEKRLPNIANAIKQYKIEGIKAKGSLLALVGAGDAKDTAIAYVLALGLLKPIVDDLKIFTAQPIDTLEIDGRVNIRINVLQIVGLITATVKS